MIQVLIVIKIHFSSDDIMSKFVINGLCSPKSWIICYCPITL